MRCYRWELRHTIASAALLAILIVGGHPGHAATPDPLPAWKDGALKSSIVAFVTAAAKQGDPGYIAAEDRIAVFDMDGTLLPEKPLPGALLPLVADVKRAAAEHPELKKQPAVAALLAGDVKALQAQGEAGVVQIVAVSIDGRTVDQVATDTAREERGAPNPRYGVPYTKLAYRPMVELLRYLEAHGFQTWICSGSPVAYTRGLSREVFGISPERVIGSYVGTRYDERDGRVVLTYTGKIEHVNDKEGKPPAINLAIGARPAFVAGNVGGVGDIAMMRYAKDRGGPSFQLLVNHDDAAREFVYAEKNGDSLAASAQYGFHVVSMKDDWTTVFDPSVTIKPPDAEPTP
jgi:phosphoserine phosphatase